MDKRPYGYERYDKLYDMIELIYILNRLSNNSYIDEGSKQYLLGVLENVESMKSNIDKYREDEHYRRNNDSSRYKYNSYSSNTKDSFLDRIIFLLKSLNDD